MLRHGRAGDRRRGLRARAGRAELSACKLRVGGKKIRGAFETCERDGLWFGRDALPAVFAQVNRQLMGYVGGYKQGDHTRKRFQGRSGGDASHGLSIAAWRNRPRKRAATVTPVNVYADRTLRCPVCSVRDLAFVVDRWACEQCHGVFVQTAAVEALVMEMIDAPWSIPAPAGAPGARACPVCVAAMTIETLDGVSLDRCAEHGVWFDPSELEAVLVREGDLDAAYAAGNSAGLVGWLRRLFR